MKCRTPNLCPTVVSLPCCCRRELNAHTLIFRTHYMWFCMCVCLLWNQLNIKSEKSIYPVVPQLVYANQAVGLLLEGRDPGAGRLVGHWSFLGLRGYLVWLTRAHSREVVGDGKTLLWAAVSSEPWQSAGSMGSSSGEHYRNLFGITAPREFRSNSRIYWLFISEKGSILLVPTGKKFLSLQKLQSINPSSAKWTLSQNMLTFPA